MAVTDGGRPRGSTLWVGLDPFGQEVVDRLGHWLTDDDAGRELAAANRLVPFAPLPDPADAGDDQPPYDPAADLVQAAMGDLLSGRQSRAALRYADRQVLVPHVWLVADLGSTETEHLAPWVARLMARLRALHVEARVYLLLRHLSWGRGEEEQLAAAARLRHLTREVLAGNPATGAAAAAFVVSDRDGVLGVYAPDETGAVVHRFADLLLLGDLAHGDAEGQSRVFVPPIGGGPGGWETLPVFGSCAGTAALWDAWGLFREHAEARRAVLVTALDRPAPATFEPKHPSLQPVSSEAAGGWPVLDLPRWSPRFWNGPRQEHDRFTDLTDAWREAAERWRHAMLVTYEDRRSSLAHQSEQARDAYFAELEAIGQQTLDDDSLPGFFSPMRRLYDRAKADLRVRRSDLGRVVAPGDVDPTDATSSVPDPNDALAGADERLVAALERKINPSLMRQVALMTWLLGVAWLALALWRIEDIWTWFVGRGEPTVPHVPEPPGQNLPGILKVPLAFFSELGYLVKLAWYQLEDATHDPIRGWLDGLQAAGVGKLVLAGVGIALAYGALLLAIAVFTALRQRVVLERAYRDYYDAARRWRDRAAHDLPAKLAARELALSRTNVTVCELVIDERLRALDRLRVQFQQPVAAPPEPDPAIASHIRPAGPPPRPLNDIQVAQILAAFRRTLLDDPGLRAEPAAIAEGLFREASRVAGDPAPDLLLEAHRLRRGLLDGFPPDGAVRCPPLAATMPAEFAPPTVARFVGAPARVAAALRLPPGSPLVVPLAVDDRFYSVVVRSGMSARRVLGLELVDEGDEPVDATASPLGAEAG